jgi:lysophospholipase L1-like esterase
MDIRLFTALSFSLASIGTAALDVKPDTIALAGDSTVAEYYKESALCGWGQVIGSRFKEGVAVKNFAAGGRSTKTFINEGQWDKLLASKPDFILLQFGHNDSHAKEKPESTDASTDYKDFLLKYADDANRAGAKIIFITPMHRRIYGKE